MFAGVKSWSSKSVGLAAAPRVPSTAWSKLCCKALCTSLFCSSSVRCQSINLQTYCPFGFRMFLVSINPISMAGPRYCPSKALSSGKVVWSWYNTQSYQPNWHTIWLMSAVSRVIIVAGTCPAVIQILLVMQERINTCNIIQWSQSRLEEPVLIIIQETPLLSSRIQPSAACIHRE